jgi:hypothetical protein
MQAAPTQLLPQSSTNATILPHNHPNYPPVSECYSKVVSIEQFCETYHLTNIKDKLETLGFRVSDTKEDLDSVTRKDWLAAGLTALQWNGLLQAVENYWETLLAMQK